MELKTENNKSNYNVGYRLGGDFKRQGVEIKPDMLLQGGATSDGKALMTDQIKLSARKRALISVAAIITTSW